MKKIPILLIFILLVIVNSNAQSEIEKLVKNKAHAFQDIEVLDLLDIDSKSKTSIDAFNSSDDYHLFTVDEKKLTELKENSPDVIKMSLILNGELETLKLVKAEIFSSDIKITSASNPSTPINKDLGVHYWGTIQNTKSSLVAISLVGNELMGLISYGGYNYDLGKLKGSNQYILGREQGMKHKTKFACSTSELHSKILEHSDNTSRSENGESCVGMYIETRWNLFNDLGSVTEVSNFVLGIMNQVFIIFLNESLYLEIDEIFIWDIQDPYQGVSDFEVLGEFSEANPSPYSDISHLLGLGSSGIAQLPHPEFCSGGNKSAYSRIPLNYNQVPSYSRSVFIISHEIGHNLGSPHTHNCSWNGGAIDGCGPAIGYSEGCNGPIPDSGTIMSYCDLLPGVGVDFNLGFGPQPGQLIRSVVLNTNCGVTCCDPTDCNSTNLQITHSADNCIPCSGDLYLTFDSNTICYDDGLPQWFDQNGNLVETGFAIKDVCPGEHYQVEFSYNETCFFTDSYEIPQVCVAEVSVNIVAEDVCALGLGQAAAVVSNLPACEEIEYEWLEGGPQGTVIGTTSNITDLYGGVLYQLKVSYNQGNCVHYHGFIIETDEASCCSELDFNDVESGWGIWGDGGADAARVNNPNFANSGNYSFRLRDNTSSSNITSTNFNFSSYDFIRIEFNYITESMDNQYEDFWLQLSDSNSTFQDIEEWNLGDEFENGVREFETVTILGPFPSSQRLRFKCDASGDWDWVYIDDILIKGCNLVNGIITEVIIDESLISNKDDLETVSRVNDNQTTQINIYPNPSNRSNNIILESSNIENIKEIQLYSLDGKKQSTNHKVISNNQLEIETITLTSGAYILRAVTPIGVISKQVLIID